MGGFYTIHTAYYIRIVRCVSALCVFLCLQTKAAARVRRYTLTRRDVSPSRCDLLFCSLRARARGVTSHPQLHLIGCCDCCALIGSYLVT
ncbi:hypothetical protein FKM82_021127 [Ascaphus truei]